MAEKNKKKERIHFPKLTDEEVKKMQSDNAELRDMCFLNVFDKALPEIQTNYMFKLRDRAAIERNFMAAFEMNGGMLGLAQWGSENPTEFYKLMARLMPEQAKAQANTQIIIQTNTPKNELDDVTITGATINIDQPQAGDEEEY